MKIDKLTSDQEQALIHHRAKWLTIGRKTGAVNMELITPVVNEFYKQIGKNKPYIWHCQSPLQAILVINFLSANLSANLYANLSANLSANLRANLYANLRANLSANLYANLRANLYANLRANLSANLSANLRANLSANKLEYISTWLWGSYDAYWVSFYKFVEDHIKPDIYAKVNSDLLSQWAIYCEHSGYWYPFDGICFVCDRPSVLNLDERGRLHSINQPAMQFSDGYSLYFYKGMAIPEWIIEHPEQITADKIDQEPNVEIRRAMTEIFTPERYMQEGKASLVHEDETGQLYYKIRLDEERLQMVRVKDPSTDREYWLRVPPTMKTAREAVAWTFGLTAEQYRLAYES